VEELEEAVEVAAVAAEAEAESPVSAEDPLPPLSVTDTEVFTSPRARKTFW